MIKKIAVLTSGGDAPGMNNVIRAIVKQAKVNSIETFLIFEGYKGLYEGNIKSATDFNVDDYISKGGTFIHTSRFPEFKNIKIMMKAKNQLNKIGIDALVVIGGDGSYKGALSLHKIGVKTITIPGTIDNDIVSSDFTVGYDTALNSIIENVERLKDTSYSHNCTMIVEVMGRDCGDLALFSGLATGANVIITNENKKTPKKIGEIVKSQYENGKRGIIVIISEYIFENINKVSQIIEKTSGLKTRNVILGHTQRGGHPTGFEKILGTRMGIKAVKLLLENKSGLAIGIINNKITATEISQALSMPKISKKKLLDEINKLNQM